jgi:hypothetical protein
MKVPLHFICPTEDIIAQVFSRRTGDRQGAKKGVDESGAKNLDRREKRAAAARLRPYPAVYREVVVFEMKILSR